MYRTKQDGLVLIKIISALTADVTIIPEPVIATSKTIKAAISILKSAKFGDKIKIISLIASREGLEEVIAAHPDVKVYYAVDDNLQGGFISPGLGDVGDRLEQALRRKRATEKMQQATPRNARLHNEVKRMTNT